MVKLENLAVISESQSSLLNSTPQFQITIDVEARRRNSGIRTNCQVLHSRNY